MIPVYVLNLARSPERRAFMQHVCAQAGIVPHFVAAVDGRRCRSATRALSAAETALILSHRKAWRRFLAQDAPFAIVLEDDAHLGAGFANLLCADWGTFAFDIVKLETLLHPTWVARRGVGFAGRHLHRLGALHLGAAGYLLSRDGVPKLLGMTRSLREPVDHTLFARASLSVLQLVPAIVVQDNLLPDQAAQRRLVTTLHEADRADIAQAARRARPRGWQRLLREAKRVARQIGQILRLYPWFRRQRVGWE